MRPYFRIVLSARYHLNQSRDFPSALSKSASVLSSSSYALRSDSMNYNATTTTRSLSLGTVGSVRRQLPFVQRPYSIRRMMTTDTNSATKSEEPYQWEYTNAQKMFEKITAKLQTENEVRLLQRVMYSYLGRPLREREFYHDGFATTTSKGRNGTSLVDDDETTAPVEVQQTAFDIKLVSFDAKAKIKIIKEVRSIAGLGLKEAKELVESAPTVIQKGISAEVAAEIKNKLVELGATIEVV